MLGRVSRAADVDESESESRRDMGISNYISVLERVYRLVNFRVKDPVSNIQVPSGSIVFDEPVPIRSLVFFGVPSGYTFDYTTFIAPNLGRMRLSRIDIHRNTSSTITDS
ncbi:MAG: hypothetical protein QXI64_10650, partial [Sulfolobales archaeon]